MKEEQDDSSSPASALPGSLITSTGKVPRPKTLLVESTLPSSSSSNITPPRSNWNDLSPIHSNFPSRSIDRTPPKTPPHPALPGIETFLPLLPPFPRPEPSTGTNTPVASLFEQRILPPPNTTALGFPSMMDSDLKSGDWEMRRRASGGRREDDRILSSSQPSPRPVSAPSSIRGTGLRSYASVLFASIGESDRIEDHKINNNNNNTRSESSSNLLSRPHTALRNFTPINPPPLVFSPSQPSPSTSQRPDWSPSTSTGWISDDRATRTSSEENQQQQYQQQQMRGEFGLGLGIGMVMGEGSGRKRSVKSTRMGMACLTCRKRKIKCSGDNPCEGCLRHNRPCEYKPITVEESRAERERRSRKLQEDLGLV